MQLIPAGVSMQLVACQAIDEVKGGLGAGHVEVAGDHRNPPVQGGAG